MGFIRIESLPGRIYVPDTTGRLARKHACPDCYGCQFCGDGRCDACRGQGPGRPWETDPEKAPADD